MIIYYVMVEGAPNRNNPESKECGGGYINCWVKADTPEDAVKKVKEYIHEENWDFVKTEDIYSVQRERYLDELDSLECYDNAVQYGLDAIFYIWPIDEMNETRRNQIQQVKQLNRKKAEV